MSEGEKKFNNVTSALFFEGMKELRALGMSDEEIQTMLPAYVQARMVEQGISHICGRLDAIGKVVEMALTKQVIIPR